MPISRSPEAIDAGNMPPRPRKAPPVPAEPEAAPEPPVEGRAEELEALPTEDVSEPEQEDDARANKPARRSKRK